MILLEGHQIATIHLETEPSRFPVFARRTAFGYAVPLVQQPFSRRDRLPMQMNRVTVSSASSSLLALLLLQLTFSANSIAIEPWNATPWYWSHKGAPVMLLGGSDDDNLFQWPEDKLIPQLDRIAAAGGNVVRNTMSDRKDAGFEVYPFLKTESGKYDLTKWNPEYWERLERFLSETASRDIFVQIEIWDRFDYTDNRADDPRRWQDHPYNPPNNINYTEAETGLANRYPDHPGQNKQPFFFSTPKQRNIQPLLSIQQAFVNKLLDLSLPYDHVLYCIDNETSGEEAWATYWADFIQARASADKKKIYVTEMWDAWDLKSDQHARTFDHPEKYAYVDISQNNHNRGQQHWDNLQFVRTLLDQQPRPMNTTKTYGADGNKFGHSDQDAIERFWRHLLGGVASARFHRPDSGLGINEKAFNCIRAARLVEIEVPFWNLSPAMDLLSDRAENEAYAAATSNASTIAIYFPANNAERSVKLDGSLASDSWQVTWIDIDQGKRTGRASLSGDQSLTPPNAGNMAAVLKRTNQPMLSGEIVNIASHKAFIFLPEPDKRTSPQPWVMYAPTLLPNYPDEHERWLHQQLLDAGIAIAGIDVGEAYGSPQGSAGMDALYEHLINDRNFAVKACLLGRSRGGLWVTSWASENLDKVAAIAGIYPVFDLTTYPGIQRASTAYSLQPQALEESLSKYNPISKAKVLAKNAMPMYLIHGIPDQVVPYQQNSATMQELYKQSNSASAFQLATIEDQGHNHWPGFFTNQAMVDFLIQHAVSRK